MSVCLWVLWVCGIISTVVFDKNNLTIASDSGVRFAMSNSGANC